MNVMIQYSLCFVSNLVETFGAFPFHRKAKHLEYMHTYIHLINTCKFHDSKDIKMVANTWSEILILGWIYSCFYTVLYLHKIFCQKTHQERYKLYDVAVHNKYIDFNRLFRYHVETLHMLFGISHFKASIQMQLVDKIFHRLYFSYFVFGLDVNWFLIHKTSLLGINY